jgi:hypothetical protein
LQNIGSVLCSQEKYVEAFYFFKKSLEIETKIFGTEDHASVMHITTILQNIGSFLKLQGINEEDNRKFVKKCINYKKKW